MNPKAPYPDPRRPWQDTARHVWRRNDTARWEPDSDQKKPARPWLILSDARIHARNIFMAVRMTTAENRQYRDHLIPNDHRYVEPQHLWTYLSERIVTSKEPQFVAPDTPAKTRGWLAQYLAFSPGDRHERLCQGRIVGVSLVPRPHSAHEPHARLGRSSQLSRADIADMQGVLTRVGLLSGDTPRDWMVPAMVLTSDHFLSLQNDHRTGLRPVVTVVPLVNDKRLLGPGAPRVRWSDRPGVEYAPLTQMLLTLDHTALAFNNKPRVALDYPGLGGCFADDQTRAQVLDEVSSFLDLSLEVDA